MSKSDNLRRAKKVQNDEFYTRLEDIEAEISSHEDYVRKFKGKTVLCNCDDPEWSAFFEFFRQHFEQLGLKKLITTHYNKDGTPSYKLEWSGEKLFDDPINMIKTPLKGDGDFRSEECVELLKEADIIVTNPPFSLAREFFIPLLVKYEKKFVIIGDLNWITYREIFPLFKDGRIKFGYTNVKEFILPDGTTQKFGNKTWFTNLDLDKFREPLILTKNYKGNEDKYPKYDNYDAIECGKVKDIPKDFTGIIGIPITGLQNFWYEEFSIIGLTQRGCHPVEMETKRYDEYWEVKQDGVKTGSSGSKTNGNPNLSKNDGKHNYFINDKGHIIQSCYQRIFIKRKDEFKILSLNGITLKYKTIMVEK